MNIVKKFLTAILVTFVIIMGIALLPAFAMTADETVSAAQYGEIQEELTDHDENSLGAKGYKYAKYKVAEAAKRAISEDTHVKSVEELVF